MEKSNARQKQRSNAKYSPAQAKNILALEQYEND
jgi:hypothetical protein